MKYATDLQAGSVVVSLSEQLTFSDHADFRDVITILVESDKPNRVLDLSALTSIDSAGLGMLVIAHEECQATDAKLVIRGAKGRVWRMLDLGKFETVLNLEP